jgi:hypothetical protein
MRASNYVQVAAFAMLESHPRAENARFGFGGFAQLGLEVWRALYESPPLIDQISRFLLS